MKDKIIERGIKNLKEYGYPNVNNENIFTDLIYSAFFKSMLEDNLGMGYDDVINEIISEIKVQD